jgi:hypothetical protein
VLSLEGEDSSVASLPLVAPSGELGIVIKSGAPAPNPVGFWAYLWASYVQTTYYHCLLRVPTQHAA